ncbi:hypothetical protein D8674_000055 [Pyrus ussuriensis x Pyrus communis]|uniref:Uncharacterized protein n=1 Tax=Pyrus ussuriensis x Pyrus communis TaxID=2448454 RepID=A0A5N5F2C7_9ROSA|nr:hypothetical protein D8674_000055 [Pyrus ussuriensis x Pyrus communis]
MRQKRKGIQLVHPFTPLESYKKRKVGDGRSVKDFVVLQEPMQFIPKPNVEENAQFETLVAGNGKGKSKAKAKEAPVFTPSNAMPHARAWNDVDQLFIPSKYLKPLTKSYPKALFVLLAQGRIDCQLGIDNLLRLVCIMLTQA